MKKAKSIVASLELFDQLSIIIDHRPTTRHFSIILEFVLNSMKETTFCHWNEHHLDHCVVNINSGNSDWPKQRKGLFAFHQEKIP